MASSSVQNVQKAPMTTDSKVKLGVVITLGLVYLIWGSTYLGISIADESMPPLLMAGVRFVIAGVVLYAGCRLAGVPNPTGRQWFSGAVVGACLLAGGNGTVVIVEQYVPSGVTALLVALVPMWTVVLLWMRRNGTRPALRTLVGVVIGLVGVGLLVLHGGGARGGFLNPLALLLILSTGSWAWGSLYAQRSDLPASPLMSTAVEMLTGGVVLLGMALVSGEPAMLAHRTITMRSVYALGYLIIFGSLVAYSAFTWLLKHTSASLVSTYAYVNPVVAVILGSLINHEAVSVWTIVSAVIIVTAVVLITFPKRRQADNVVIENRSSADSSQRSQSGSRHYAALEQG